MAVALKLSKGPIVYALQKYDFIVLFPVNPVTLARYRQAFTPSGAKDDPSDAELALDLLVCHRDKFAPLQPQSAPMRTLIHLVEQRRQLVNDKLRFTNRLPARSQGAPALRRRYPRSCFSGQRLLVCSPDRLPMLPFDRLSTGASCHLDP